MHIGRMAADLSVGRKLAALGLAGILGLGVFATVTLRTLADVRVGSVGYEEIIENNVLLADVLPPPAYLVETHLVAHEAALAQMRGDVAGVEQRIEYLAQLEQDYLDRQAYWTASELVPDSTRELILETSAEPAFAYFELIRGPFTEALRGTSSQATLALLDGPMTDSYDEHRVGVDAIVETTTSEAARIEGEVRDAAGRASASLVTLLLVTVEAVVATGWSVARTITRPLSRWWKVKKRLSR